MIGLRLFAIIASSLYLNSTRELLETAGKIPAQEEDENAFKALTRKLIGKITSYTKMEGKY